MTASHPNILFILSDQHRADWVGYEGDVPVRTPNLDALVEDGVAFSNAITPSPVCGPARSCLASGLEYDRCYVRDHHAGQDYPLGAPTLYGRLRAAGGYHTIGTGKFDLQKYSGNWGTDGRNDLTANGFAAGMNCAANHTMDDVVDPYTDFLDREGLLHAYVSDQKRRADSDDRSYQEGQGCSATFPTSLPDYAYQDNFIARRSLDFLEGAPADQPWFLQVNFVKPHEPFDVTESMHEWYRDPNVEFPHPLDPDGQLDAATHQAIRRNYAAMVENIDRRIGDFLDALEERGERENTIVIYSSDHGESLGDRGSWWKRTPFQESVGVPLVVSGANVTQRGVVSPPATLLDVHATVLDYADVAVPNLQSQSFRPYLDGETDVFPRDTVVSGLGPWRMVFDGRYKLVQGFDPANHHNKQVSEFDAYDEAAVNRKLAETKPLLFDLESDPEERENIAEQRPEVVCELQSYIDTLRQ